jgi:hypothetical protein
MVQYSREAGKYDNQTTKLELGKQSLRQSLIHRRMWKLVLGHKWNFLVLWTYKTWTCIRNANLDPVGQEKSKCSDPHLREEIITGSWLAFLLWIQSGYAFQLCIQIRTHIPNMDPDHKRLGKAEIFWSNALKSLRLKQAFVYNIVYREQMHIKLHLPKVFIISSCHLFFY